MTIDRVENTLNNYTSQQFRLVTKQNKNLTLSNKTIKHIALSILKHYRYIIIGTMLIKENKHYQSIIIINIVLKDF